VTRDSNVRTQAGNRLGTLPLSTRVQGLQEELSQAIAGALPWAAEMDRAIEDAQPRYRAVAEVLVALRHQFPAPDGQPHDLRGRSAGYRALVREAYVQAGAEATDPVAKRLTAGAAYWVRKILLERYGDQTLRDMGVIRGAPEDSSRDGRHQVKWRGGLDNLKEVVGALNVLATDPDLVPTEELVRSVMRAANLLQQRLMTQTASERLVEMAV
jgi:hypothetical protein